MVSGPYSDVAGAGSVIGSSGSFYYFAFPAGAGAYFRFRDPQGAVFSSSVVGYMNLLFPQGSTEAVVPQLEIMVNTIAQLIPSAPDGAYVVNAVGQTNYCSNAGSGAQWDDPSMRLQPGETFSFYTPENLVLTFAGRIDQANITNVFGDTTLALPLGSTRVLIPQYFTDDSIGEVLPSAPDGAYVVNAAGETNYCSNVGLGAQWDDPLMPLPPGNTFTFYNPTSEVWFIVFAGVPNPSLDGDFVVPRPSAPVYSTPYSFDTLVGRSTQGSDDGTGVDAQFNHPKAVTVSSAGGNTSLYVADRGNHTIRKLTLSGVATSFVGLAANPGAADGSGTAARFSSPGGVAADSAGNLFVADTGNHTIRKITPAGLVSTIAGTAGAAGATDGTNSDAGFYNPSGVAVDTLGNVYVADTYNHWIRKLTPVGTNWVVTTLAGSPGAFSGFADGTGSSASFHYPSDLAVDSSGNVYVADTYNSAIRKVTPAGVVTTLAGGSPGSLDGTNRAAQFELPYSVRIDSSGNLYVADTYNDTIRKMALVGTDWVVTTVAGSAGSLGSTDGTKSAARFNFPQGVVAVSGRLYVTDSANNSIRIILAGGVVGTLAGAVSAGDTDYPARFSYPAGVAVDGAGYVYVADRDNDTLRMVTPDGLVFTLAGSPGNPGTNNGTGSDVRFFSPSGVAVDSAGNLYVADRDNHAIRKLSADDGEVTTLAGLPGVSGATDGTGSAARFHSPSGVALDGAGNLYVADTGNDTIRKITPAGVATTLARYFYQPQGVAVDSATNVYVADTGDDLIRKVTPAGGVTTLAGGYIPPNGYFSYGSEDGTNSQFYSPAGVAVDSDGTVYVADNGNHTIRKVTPVGTNWVVSTLAGVPQFPGSADGVGSGAQFSSPSALAVDAAGNLYVADSGNNTIRKGALNQYAPTNPVPYVAPLRNGQLVVTLLPASGQLLPGQWRFPWDLAWRNSGVVVRNLAADNYTLEFRNLPGYLAYPPILTVAVTNGGPTYVTNQYYPTLNVLGTTNTGALTVNIGPGAPTGAGWRFLGETVWRSSGSTNAGLVPDTYDLEFAPVSGYSKPADRAVQVSASFTTVVSANYLLPQSPPAGVLLPVPVPTNSISDLSDYPYGFNGQLQSDLEVGYGSGVAVQPNVVLTAAHLVFDDQTLSYVSQVYWYLQEEAGVFTPEPLAARGWYVLSGYAAQRTNDFLGGLGPDQSSPQSRNLDVAALYFPSPVAGGGYGGYLPSDTVPNPWLTGTGQKMLVGYPVDGSVFGDASIVPGVMYVTGPQPSPLSLATNSVPGQQEVYVAPWLLSYPGNSGGPFYVQFNGYYYPAGVYLGTLYNGDVPYASLVRGIDSNVVNLITLAQTLGDAGTNGTGGGVITIIGGPGGLVPPTISVQLEPSTAVAAGAGWRVQGTTDWVSDPNYIYPVTNSSVVLEFKPIFGWDGPTNQNLTLTTGRNIITAYYTPSPALSVNPVGGLVASGLAGGPFTPGSITCTLSNAGAASLYWLAAKTVNWLSLSASNGMLVAGATTNVSISVNANANSLTAGSYSDTVGFTNLSNGLGNTTRSVSLLVSAHPPVQLSGVRRLTNGAVAMTLQGVTGRVYSIVTSTNLLTRLTNWAELLRLTNTAGQTVFTNPPPSSSPQYYRAKEL